MEMSLQYEVCFAIDLGPFIDTSLKDLERPWSSATAAIKKLIRRYKTPADSRGTIFGKRVEVRFMRESRKIYFVGL
jgi:hypothetical protein